MKKTLVAMVATLGVPLVIGATVSPVASADPGQWFDGSCPNGYVMPRAPHVCAAPAVIDDFGFVTPFALAVSDPGRHYDHEIPVAEPFGSPFCGMYDLNAPGARDQYGRLLGCVRAVLPA